MDDMLSQEELNALLNGIDSEEENATDILISDAEKEAIGTLSNISMKSAAETLQSLVNLDVHITSPEVKIYEWEEFLERYKMPCVAIQIVYKEGFEGMNVLLLREEDVKIIADLMMGGNGMDSREEISDLNLSAIGEAMNQMIGSGATSIATKLNKKIDIQPPESLHININESFDPHEVADFLTTSFIQVSFRIQIGDLIDSEIMQLYPLKFAQKIYDEYRNMDIESVEGIEERAGVSSVSMQQQPMMNGIKTGNSNMTMQGQGMSERNIEVQQAQFQQFDVGSVMQQKENIDLIMDVQLEVTVELGRTHRSIKDILEFAPGTILELNKLSGEPVDVLVNGKIVAKGEVVVIDENFSIRVTEIMKGKGVL